MEKSIQNKIDSIWLDFANGGMTDPLSVIKQMTYLLFIKGLDESETNNEQTEQLLGVKFDRIFDDEHQDCRWSKFKNLSADEMYNLMSNKIFPFIKNLKAGKDSSFSKYMAKAMFMVPSALVLEKVVTKLDSIPMKNRDTKGDIYEYLLSKLATAGRNGQFRTPRHIIKMMVKLVKPMPNDTICDPACGTGGFLLESSEYLRENHQELNPFMLSEYIKSIRPYNKKEIDFLCSKNTKILDKNISGIIKSALYLPQLLLYLIFH